jgi:hypothetical protein
MQPREVGCKQLKGQGDFGAGDGTRTHDPELGKLVLYQLSYTRSHCVLTQYIAQVFPGEKLFGSGNHRLCGLAASPAPTLHVNLLLTTRLPDAASAHQPRTAQLHMSCANQSSCANHSLRFADPDVTAKGEQRAKVALRQLETLWFNTGSLCNIDCAHCYMESSPKNDRLAYLSAAEASAFFNEIATLRLPVREIGFTGGEPFMNPQLLTMAGDALRRGFSTLILTNAMQPMLRRPVQLGLLALREAFGDRLVLRVSLDHYAQRLHERERGAGSWDATLRGVDWLVEAGFKIALAGRAMWEESEQDLRNGYASLSALRCWGLNAEDPAALVLFPEMDEGADVPEITTACWAVLGKSPDQVMCSASRMVVRRAGAARPTVVPCTLIPYVEAFDMGSSLTEAVEADGGLFDHGAVKLCHPHCARFCVLGGGKCSA